MGASEVIIPRVIVVGGPNGAGKTTAASALLPQDLAVQRFVNADTIAAGLSAFDPESVAMQAGRIMLLRIAELSRRRCDFAFETTLASRTFVPFLRRLQGSGYHVHVVYVWLCRPELAIQRVALRVKRGGHDVRPDVVRRRYWRGFQNFRQLYRPRADSWVLCDNSGDDLVVVARGDRTGETEVVDQERHERFERSGPDN